MNTSIKIICLAGMVSFVACGSLATTDSGNVDGSTVASTETRAITGSLTTVDGNETELASSEPASNNQSSQCRADTVIATDTAGNTSTSDVASDCSFSLNLIIGKSYAISFVLNNEFVANLVFDSGLSGFSTSAINVSDDTSPIDLGSITISGNTAQPQHNPLDQCDYDGDGLSDLADLDDDNDLLIDEDELDCDFDGFIDDIDAQDASCQQSPLNTARVLRVKPSDDRINVDLEKDIKLRAACRIDPASVDNTTFNVTSATADDVVCDFKRSGRRGHGLRCSHRDVPFASNTVYTVTVDGIMCRDGRALETVEFSFLTEGVDADIGDLENTVDENAEEEVEDDEVEEDDDDEEDDLEDDDDEDEDDDDDDDDDAVPAV